MRRGRHAAQRPAPWRGVLVALALFAGSGIAGTWAYWTDSATVTSGTIESGSMDLQFDVGGPGFGEGIGTGYVASQIAANALAPGESMAFPLLIRNVGDPDFSWSATARQHTTWTFQGSPIEVTLSSGNPENSGTTYPRLGTCSGGLVGSSVILASSASTLLSGRQLAGGGTDTMCLVVRMLPTASNDNQSKSGVVRIDVVAEQVMP